MAVFFTQIYIYIYNYNNKIIYMFIYNKSLKKCLRLFNKTFSNYQATNQKELYLLFEKSGNFFHRVSIEIGLTPPLPLFVFIRSLRTPLHNKPFIKKGSLEEMEGVNDNASAFMHLNIKTNNGKKLLFKLSRVIYVRKLNFSTLW